MSGLGGASGPDSTPKIGNDPIKGVEDKGKGTNKTFAETQQNQSDHSMSAFEKQCIDVAVKSGKSEEDGKKFFRKMQKSIMMNCMRQMQEAEKHRKEILAQNKAIYGG
ncbi:MAG: hypothetical protein S4CHLAM45_00660 [Chlamydiales bacterium]|nr:hypothetical protein [Chlamydiales bacterium]MCH9619388.1 hypothetical protein [Chlamydiales bacterium]MCH9622192.1 hypothetical protein [Chlamydiales bacterium]